MSWLSKLFGGGKASDELQVALDNRGLVVDVREPAEFAQGHLQGSVNYPLSKFNGSYKRLLKKHPNQALILVCRSGNRSGQAAQILRSNGAECINGGSWQRVAALSKAQS